MTMSALTSNARSAAVAVSVVKKAAGAAGDDHHAPSACVVDGAQANVRFMTALMASAVCTRVTTWMRSSASRKRQPIHDQAIVAPMIGRALVHARPRAGGAAPEVAAADHHRDLHAQVVNLSDLGV
ncbi:MAG: hypothetical protein IPK19_13355 [Chloroflexi bacterium]|nr:hypothetical protein [Chloroflexota bacterium]